MRERVLPFRLPSTPSDGGLLECRPIEDSLELAAHFRIRHEVFVLEQHLFADSDHDLHDDDVDTVHVLGLVNSIPAGGVRLYPVDDRLWKGDRLAVARQYRRVGIGRPLVKCAVALAASLGGERMDAQVQVANVNFFKILGWSCVGEPTQMFGVPHQHMSIALG